MPFIPIIIGIGLMISAGPIFGMVGSMLLFNTMLGIGLSLTLGGIEKAIKGTPKMSSLSSSALDRKVSIRQPISNGRVIYGTAHVGGIITYLESTGTNNEFLHIVYTLSAHLLNSIDTMYFDGVSVTLDGSGNATGTYAGLVHVEKNLGSRDQTAFSGLVSSSGGKWTSAHRQRGRAGVYVRLKYDQNKFPNGVPNVSFDVSGRTLRNTSGTIGASSNAALALNDYLLDSNFGLGAIRKIPIPSSGLTQSGLGAFNAANLVDGDVATVGFNTDAASTGAAVTMDLGSAYEPVELRIFTTTGTYAGIFDLSYSDNGGSTWTALLSSIKPDAGKVGIPNKFRLAMAGAHRWWKLGLTNTPGAGADITVVQLYESQVDRTQLIDAVNTCNESVALAAGGSEARYTADGAFETGERPADAITALAGAMAGYIHYTGGKFWLFPGEWRAPAGAALATPAMVNSALGSSVSTSPSIGTFVGGNVRNNTNVIAVREQNSNSLHITGVTDDQGNAYTKIADGSAFDGTINNWISWWLAPVTVGGTSNNNFYVAFSAGPSAVNTRGMEFSGVDLASPFDAWARPAAPNSGFSVSYPISPAAGGDLLIMFNTRQTAAVNWSGFPGTDIFGATGTFVELNWSIGVAGSNTMAVSSSGAGFGSHSIALKAASVSTGVFTEDDIAGPMTVTPKVSRREIFNTIRGTYVSAVSKWEPTNFPAVSNPNYVTEDGGDVIYLDAELPFTISNARAQRISRIALNRARRQMIANVRFKLNAYNLMACSVIKMTNARFGWVEKTFEVKSIQLASEPSEDEKGVNLFVDCSLRETDSNVYDWNPANDELTPAGTSPIAMVDLQTCAPVTGLTASSRDGIGKDSGRILIVVLNWTAPADQHVIQGGWIHVYYKLHTDSGWTQAGTLAGASTVMDIPNITSGLAYDYKVVAQNVAGVFSTDTIITSITKKSTVSGMITYRPLSNPLTAHDAGSNVTINIASFTMRIQGVADVTLASGAITGKSYNTLYYIYYDDPTGEDTTVTFVATLIKEEAIFGNGRFYVGSILTPRAGAVDTVGNNDGGVGAQSGNANVFGFVVVDVSQTSGGGVTAAGLAVDGFFTSYCDVFLTGSQPIVTESVTLGGLSMPNRQYSEVKVKARIEIFANNLTPGGVAGNIFVRVNYPDGTGFSSHYFIGPLNYGAGAIADATYEFTLPQGINYTQVTVELVAGSSATSITGGSLSMYVRQVWVEATD